MVNVASFMLWVFYNNLKKKKIYGLSHSFNNHLLRAYCVSGSSLSTEDTITNITDRESLPSWGLESWRKLSEKFTSHVKSQPRYVLRRRDARLCGSAWKGIWFNQENHRFNGHIPFIPWQSYIIQPTSYCWMFRFFPHLNYLKQHHNKHPSINVSWHTCLSYFLRIRVPTRGIVELRGTPHAEALTTHCYIAPPQKKTCIISIPISNVKQNPVPPHPTNTTCCYHLYKTWPVLWGETWFLVVLIGFPLIDYPWGWPLFLFVTDLPCG